MFDEFMNEKFGPPPAGGYSPIQMEQFRVALSKHAIDAWQKRDEFADRMKELKQSVVDHANGKLFQMDTPTSEAKEDSDDMPALEDYKEEDWFEVKPGHPDGAVMGKSGLSALRRHLLPEPSAPSEDTPPLPDWGRREYDGTCQVMRGTTGYGLSFEKSKFITTKPRPVFTDDKPNTMHAATNSRFGQATEDKQELKMREVVTRARGWDALTAQQAERDKKNKADLELQSKIDQSVAVDKLINYMEEANKFVAARTARPTFTIEDDKERKMHIGHMRFDAPRIGPSLSTDGKTVQMCEWVRSSTSLTPSQKRNMRRRRNAKLLHKILA